MFELIFNKRLRKNYNNVLKLKTVEEIKNFLSSLNKKERHELFTYSYGYAVKKRNHDGVPVTEYFLLHCDEFITDSEKSILDKADKHLSIMFTVATAIIAITLLL